jgi:hypothetical protein
VNGFGKDWGWGHFGLMLLMEDEFGFMDMSQYGHAELTQNVAPSVIQHQPHPQHQQHPQTVLVRFSFKVC